ncbi:MAG: glycoside hydrolase family 5 protein [Bryobacteraceae bacterium]
MKPLILFAALLAFEHSGAAQTQFVRAQGRELIGIGGKPLALHGISLGNWFLPEGYMFRLDHGPASRREIDALFRDLIGPDATDRFWREWRDTYISRADIELIRRAGFNSVRIPLDHSLFVENGSGFATLDRAIGWCRENGILAILDLHAAPGGQTGTNIDDSWGYPWLFESQQARGETIALWRRIALRYRNEPAVLGYDLLNEPIPQFPCLRKYNAMLEPLYRQIVAAIREVDKNHIAILGGAQWDTNFKVFGAPFDSNTMYTFHKYWMEPTRAAIEEYLDYRDRYNVPIWLGESGENSDEWIVRFRSVLEENHVGWCFWPYKKMDQTSSVVTFARPRYWDEIVAYARLPGGVGELDKRSKARPSVEHAQAALADLLKQIRFENRRVNQGYLKALGM